MTAQHAVSAVYATALERALSIKLVGAGVDTNVHEFAFPAGSLGGGEKGFGAIRHVEFRRRCERFSFKHIFRFIVVRIERITLDCFGPSPILEYFSWRSDMHIEVHQRAPTDTAALNDVNLPKGSVVKETIVFEVPERASHLSGGSGKVLSSPTLPTFKNTDRAASLSQTASIDRTAKS